MKKLLFAALISTFALVACNGDKVADLEKRNKMLSDQTVLQDSLLNDFLKAFNDFEDNLAMIKEKEALISMEAGEEELRPDQKERILEDIQMINDLLDQNRSLIEELSAKVDASDGKIQEFRGIVSRLKRDLKQRDAEIGTMKEELVALNFEKESLFRQVDTLRRTAKELATIRESQAQVIDEKEEDIALKEEKILDQRARLNSAFYVAGTAKELMNMNVLEKTGVIGVGRNPKMASDFDPNVFTRVDITEFQSLPVETKKAKIITAHPTDSYAINETEKGHIESLEITDPDKFWQASRYLVVVLN
jgi:hypothetical protein